MPNFQCQIKGPMPPESQIVNDRNLDLAKWTFREKLHDWADQVEIQINPEGQFEKPGPKLFVVKKPDGSYMGPLGPTRKVEEAVRFTTRAGALIGIQQVGVTMHNSRIVPYATELAKQGGGPSDG